MSVLSHFSCSLTLCNPMDCSPPGFLCPWDSPGKNTGVGCHFLLQGIFLTQGLNPCLLCVLQLRGFFTNSGTWEAQPQLRTLQSQEEKKKSAGLITSESLLPKKDIGAFDLTSSRAG